MENNDGQATQEDDTTHIRFSDLERKVQEQSDEIVSLKSTLADVLRRLAQLEGKSPVLTNQLPTPQSPTNSEPLVRSASGLSLRSGSNGSSPTFPINSSRCSGPQRHSFSYGYGQTSIASRGSPQLKNGRSTPNGSPSPTPSQPVLSPSAVSSISRIGGIIRQIPSPSRQISLSVSNLAKMKRLSGSSDLSNSTSTPNSPQTRRPPSGSLFNIHARSTASPTSLVKHGTKDAFLNNEEGTIKMYLQGRPLIMHIPTRFLNDYVLRKVNSSPQQRLKLEWVYGYRGRDCRSNLFLLPTGEIVYFLAAVVVLYNVEEQSQRHYLEHSDDIKCITIHPNKLVIATGQMGGLNRRNNKPHVRIWDSVSLHTLHIIGIGELERSAICVAFSKMDGGSLLCIVDESTDHTISLWEWQRGEAGYKVTETKSSSDTVLAAEFHPMDRYCLITIGKGHVHFWDTEGGTLAKKLGLFEKHDKPKYILCMAFSNFGDLLTGDSNGNIMIWGRGSNRVSRTIYGAHEGGVFSICVMKNGCSLSGGGKDRRILEWDETMVPTGREAQVAESMGGVRTLSQGKGSLLMIGTVRNCLLQGTLTMGFSPIAQGHTDEIWALAVHPTQNQFLSGGYDRLIHMWDSMAHSAVWSKEMMECVQCACFSPDGNVLVVATRSGEWVVLDTATKKVHSMHADGNEAISCAKFSPDGKNFALGSHDNYVYVYQVNDGFKKFSRIGRCGGHSSYVTNLDWSEDGVYIQSVSGDYELLFWNATVCRQVSNMSIARDIEWHTHSCTLGFGVFGIWTDGMDGTDINTCNRSNNGKMLVSGDDFGKVNLYAYPACQPKCLHQINSGHSSHVTNVSFLPDDTRVISLGGRDCGVFQWALT